MTIYRFADYGAKYPAPTETEPLYIGRIVRQERDRYLLAAKDGLKWAEVTGKLRHEATLRSHFPVVGDWVTLLKDDDARAQSSNQEETEAEEIRVSADAVGTATISSILSRQSLISRKSAGSVADEQPLVANVDVVFLVAAANQELNIRRIERYLAGVWDTGATPVVVINKMDLCEDVESLRSDLAAIALTVQVIYASAASGDGLDEIQALIAPQHRTAAFLGSSGVGKSSITNRLLGNEIQLVSEIRLEDDKGRHTTTRRELFPAPGGGVLIDTPGLREFGLWDGDASSFADIDSLAQECRFADCSHQSEPSCAVKAAVDRGELDSGRLESYLKLQRELEFIERKKDVHLDQARRQRDKIRQKDYRTIQKTRAKNERLE